MRTHVWHFGDARDRIEVEAVNEDEVKASGIVVFPN